MLDPKIVLRACGQPYTETGLRLLLQCPFHDDRTPSAVVYLADATFHCFGCDAHGDMIYFYARSKEIDRDAARNDMAARGWDVRPATLVVDERLISSLSARVRACGPSGPSRLTSARYFELWDKAVWAYRSGRLTSEQLGKSASKIRASHQPQSP